MGMRERSGGLWYRGWLGDPRVLPDLPEAAAAGADVRQALPCHRRARAPGRHPKRREATLAVCLSTSSKAARWSVAPAGADMVGAAAPQDKGRWQRRRICIAAMGLSASRTSHTPLVWGIPGSRGRGSVAFQARTE